MTAIWNGASTTPAATHRVPVDVSSSGGPTRWTGQQIADLRAYVGGTVNNLGSINTNQSLSLADGLYIAATITGNVQFTFTSVPTGFTDLFLELTNAGAYTVSFAATIGWTGGTTPSLPAVGVALIHLYTRDGGTSYIAHLVSDEQQFDAAAIISGTLVHERGGLEADVSAYSGLVKISGGTTSAVATAAGIETFLGTPSSANLAAAVTDETGSGALVFATSPTLVTPTLGTPSSGTLTNCTGYPAATSSASGIVELAIASEVDTGTDATRAMTPDSYRDSTPYYTDRAADWTLAQADGNTEQQFNSASALVCTIDTNANVAISIGTIVPLVRIGAGSATIDAVAGVTLNGVDGGSKVISTRYQGALLRKTGTNAWILSGDIA